MMDHKTVLVEKRSRDARVVRSRAALRDALVTLLQDRDLVGITVQMIVAEAGIGYATFFRHYASVEALLIDLAETMIAEFIAQAMPAIMSGDRASLLAALVDYVAERQRAIHALLIGGGETVRREIIARAIDRAAALPTNFDPALPVQLAIAHAVSASIEILTWSVRQTDVVDRLSLAALIERLALRPLSP